MCLHAAQRLARFVRRRVGIGFSWEMWVACGLPIGDGYWKDSWEGVGVSSYEKSWSLDRSACCVSVEVVCRPSACVRASRITDAFLFAFRLSRPPPVPYRFIRRANDEGDEKATSSAEDD